MQNRYQAEKVDKCYIKLQTSCIFVVLLLPLEIGAKKDLSDKKKEMTRERRGECQWRAYDQHKYDQHNKREGEVSFYIASLPIYRILPSRPTNIMPSFKCQHFLTLLTFDI